MFGARRFGQAERGNFPHYAIHQRLQVQVPRVYSLHGYDLQFYRSGWFVFAMHLLPYIPTHDVTMPPVTPVVWLQYLVILGTAEDMNQRAHRQITQEVSYFLKLCREYSIYENALTSEKGTLPLLMKKVLIFYSVRSFYIEMTE